jgi:uncharacterized protein (TIGR02145 family)
MSRFGLFILVLLSFSSLFSQIPSYVPTNGLVAWWPFNGNANDESGNGNNGTVNGATLTSDRFGNANSAYNFVKLNQNYLTINNTAGNFGTSNFTISIWFLSSDPNVSSLINKRYNESWGNYWELRSDLFGINDATNGTNYSSLFNINNLINLWHNCIIIRNSNSLKYFFNGSLIQEINTPIIHNISNSNNLIIGSIIAPISGVLQSHEGIIDDIGIWNRALTQQEITELYTSSDPFDVSATNTTVCAGQPTTLSVQSVSGTITALNCASATNSGTLTAGTAASGVSSSIPYTGGNGGTHNGQTVTSTGVTGLTATLTSGTFASGNGSLTYTITGTPSASGTANFALNIGGQTCILTRTISNLPQLATLTTSTVSSISSPQGQPELFPEALSGGNITSNGGAAITAIGIVWSTSPNPTLASNLGSTNDGSCTCNFGSILRCLIANTTYYVRAYATNSAGTAYGNQVSFTTQNSVVISNPGGGVSFNDYTYASIELGNGQEWMAENLRTNIYANGDPIPNVTDNAQWNVLNTGAWAHFNNDSQYENPFGKLYNWYAVADLRNICPTGWHVPTEAEWTVLTDYLGGSCVAGGKMKSIGTQYWESPNQDATDEIGFSGLPGGLRYFDGTGFFDGVFSNHYMQGIWWSSTELNTGDAWNNLLNYDNGKLSTSFNVNNKKNGFSVRCLKD